MKRLLIPILLCLAAFASSAQSQRERVNFDKGWQFAFGDASSPAKDFGCGTEYFNYFTKAASIHNEGPYVAKFDASGWEVVDLPHDWVVDLPYAAEASHSHGYKTVGYKYPETSVGWYRKTFTIPAEDYGKHIWVEFDGIFRDSQVWLNGFYLGHEKSGYASQTYDISEYLNYGGENGFNVIFLFGHNHSGDYDSYLGGSSIYLAKGDTMLIAKPENYKEYQEIELKFTYMNAGYVGYHVEQGADWTLTMTTFKIQADGSVIITRYDKDGYHNLKSKGVRNTVLQDTFDPDLTVYESSRVVTADDDRKYEGD